MGVQDKLKFDQQASEFDARAGLTAERAAIVARAVVGCSTASSVRVLEIGAGTGEIGAYIAPLTGGYVALDSAKAMLDEFAARRVAEVSELVHADADGPWPASDSSLDLVFGSRVFHLLDHDHVARECRRVAAPAGLVLVSGRVERDKQSPKVRVRKQMRVLLEQAGFAPRPTDRLRKQFWQAMERSGAQVAAAVPAVNWQVVQRPIDSIDAWRHKKNMGGILPPEEIKMQVLADLESWAEQEYGSLAAEVACTETYVLECARFV